MKIAVVGAGAMGCLYGAYLSTKHEVTMVDSYLPQVEAWWCQFEGYGDDDGYPCQCQ